MAEELESANVLIRESDLFYREGLRTLTKNKKTDRDEARKVPRFNID